MDIEWDEAKRKRTLESRGLDFSDVSSVEWADALTVEDKREDYLETRYVTIAPIHKRLCVFAYCWRGEKLRVISLRKANKREQKRYAKAIR